MCMNIQYGHTLIAFEEPTTANSGHTHCQHRPTAYIRTYPALIKYAVLYALLSTVTLAHDNLRFLHFKLTIVRAPPFRLSLANK
jgi:hypothetical protein